MCIASQDVVQQDSSTGHRSHLRLQHELRDVEVPLSGRNVEGGGAHRPHAVRLAPLDLGGGAGAKLQQGLHSLQVAASRCKMQRRKTTLGLDVGKTPAEHGGMRVSQLGKQCMEHCRLQQLQEAARRLCSRLGWADRQGDVLHGEIEGRAHLLPAAWVASWGSLMLLWLSRASWQPTMPFQAA